MQLSLPSLRPDQIKNNNRSEGVVKTSFANRTNLVYSPRL